MSSDPRSIAREAIRRFESGQTDFEEIFDAQGVRNLMIRDSEDPRFFRVEAEDPNHEFVVTMTGIRLPPSESRPRELPEHVPFLPDTATVVMIMPATGAVVVRWEDPTEPREAFAHLRGKMLEEAWEEFEAGALEASGPEETGPMKSLLRKGDASRTLVLFPGTNRTDLVLTQESTEEARSS